MSERRTLVPVWAWQTDEAFGYDRFRADEYFAEQGNQGAVLVLCKPGESRLDLIRKIQAGLEECR